MRSIFCIKVVLCLLVLSGCVSPIPLPHYSTVRDGSPTALDGFWKNDGQSVFRIKNGVMYLIQAKATAKSGGVYAKDIYLKKFPFFAATYLRGLNMSSDSWFYGPSEIEVISEDKFILKTFASKEPKDSSILILPPLNVIYTNVSLDNPKALATYFQKNNQNNNLVHLNPSILKKPPPDIIPASSIGQRFALVIGISNYKDSRIPSLRYANKDAQVFYNWLVSPEGGKYSPSNIRLLIDHDATVKNIKSSLYERLKTALTEDMVTIYFAGHGSPDSPDSPDNLYLLSYDTDYSSIASTGFPMWDIETALKRFIKAKKVVVIADACHSGGVGQSFDIARRSKG